MLLLNFYLLILGFAMINFSFCYDYILDYDSESIPVADKFQRRSINSKKYNHRRADQIKSRNNEDNRAHSRHKKKDDDVLYLDVAKFLNPSEKFVGSYDSHRLPHRSITENDLDLRFQEPSREVRKARKFERELTRGNIHDHKEYYYLPANRKRLVQKKIKPSRSKYLGSFNENIAAARLKPALKRDASSKTSFRNSKNKFARLPRDKARSNKERRFSIFHKSKTQNKNNKKNNATEKNANHLDSKEKQLNEKPIPPNKELKTSAKKMKLNPVKESKPLKQIHVCPLCKREIDNVQRESGKKESTVERVQRIRRRKLANNTRHGLSGRRRTRKRIFKNDNVYK